MSFHTSFDFDKDAFLLKRQHPWCYRKAFVEKKTFPEGKKRVQMNCLKVGRARRSLYARTKTVDIVLAPVTVDSCDGGKILLRRYDPTLVLNNKVRN